MQESIYHHQIIRFFGDLPGMECPFSIHRLVEIGVESGKQAGDWYGPASVAYVLRYIVLSSIILLFPLPYGLYLLEIVAYMFVIKCSSLSLVSTAASARLNIKAIGEAVFSIRSLSYCSNLIFLALQYFWNVRR